MMADSARPDRAIVGVKNASRAQYAPHFAQQFRYGMGVLQGSYRYHGVDTVILYREGLAYRLDRDHLFVVNAPAEGRARVHANGKAVQSLRQVAENCTTLIAANFKDYASRRRRSVNELGHWPPLIGSQAFEGPHCGSPLSSESATPDPPQYVWVGQVSANPAHGCSQLAHPHEATPRLTVGAIAAIHQTTPG
jgi:hypothetical protein